MSNLCLTAGQSDSIERLLKTVLRNKFEKYEPETNSMPFHTRLLGKDRLALFSFIHSMNTNFGNMRLLTLLKEIILILFLLLPKRFSATIFSQG